MPGTMTLGGTSSGPIGQNTIGPLTDTRPGTASSTIDVDLVAGDNTVAIPTGAGRVAILIASGASETVTVRTDLNSSDTGLPITPYSTVPWTSFPLPAGTTQVILNASDTVSGVELSFI